MFGNSAQSDIWVDREAVEFLQATDEEIDCLKQLRTIQLKQRDAQTSKQAFHIPSMIIDNFLYHGAIEHARDIDLLDKLNIQSILNVSHIRLNRNITNRYNVLWINIQDDVDVDIRQYFNQTNEFLEVCKRNNTKVLVHCRKDVSRSSAIIVAYLLRSYFNTLREAYNHLVEQRWIAVPNDAFFLQLIRYEKDLRASSLIE
ncbi:unnamed protein product [Rotaria magnacalcarata]|uniref:protein-tyrosine-phosphatase n=1 Tax=Rotaria magnacalcarata TaxID=392030 RepID=A0A815YLK5_9BILA|nr:unnamed protein product [Rotaria magnacalcarata]CAF1571564.1 unnamed protein product [Rotaria magnacalcarata]CAF2032107.1 unnamed protein product [Rotaria magnacalcarata]CAF4033021.1 unnamed protein product [Rotaria magnacalcarata]